MKRANLYIYAPTSEPQVALHNDKRWPIRKAKRSEVPPMYRKNLVQKANEILGNIALAIAAFVAVSAVTVFIMCCTLLSAR